MNTMHTWVLWRLVVVALMVFPFVVSAVITGIRRRQAEGSSFTTGPDDRNASLPSAGPEAWGREGNADGRVRSIDEAAGVERRAA